MPRPTDSVVADYDVFDGCYCIFRINGHSAMRIFKGVILYDSMTGFHQYAAGTSKVIVAQDEMFASAVGRVDPHTGLPGCRKGFPALYQDQIP